MMPASVEPFTRSAASRSRYAGRIELLSGARTPNGAEILILPYGAPGLKTEPLSWCRRNSPASVNLLLLERNREAMDDDELIAAMAGGDDTALRESFARHAPWLAARLRLDPARGRGGGRAAGELPGRLAGRGAPARGPPGGWLWGITRRQVALWLRRRGPDGLPLAALAGHGGQRTP